MIRHDTVNVYGPAGNFMFSFGSTGSTNGLFNQPTGLAINEALGEIYVADRQIIQASNSLGGGSTIGARIQAFDKSGKYLRTLPMQYGVSVGQIASPAGLAVDQAGKLYVVDNLQRAVLIFDAQTGASYGALYDMTVPLQIPLGVTIGSDNIARITSYGGPGVGTVEKYDVGNCVSMEVQKTAIPFIVQQYNIGTPAALPISIKNSCSGTLSWTVNADQPWITVGSGTGTTGPNSTTIFLAGVNTANISSLAPGSYTGTVIVQSAALHNVSNNVPVTLTVSPPSTLSVAPGWLDFQAKRGKKSDPQTVAVAVQNAANITWSVKQDLPAWLTITPSSGATTMAAVSVNTAILATGTYTPDITFSAPGVSIGDGSKLRVNVRIDPLTRITVTTNRPDASFTLAGPNVSYAGAGANWSMEDAIAGNYLISYNAVTGYRRPLPQTKTLLADSDLSFMGNYVSWKDIAAKKNIVMASRDVLAARLNGTGTLGKALIRTIKATDFSLIKYVNPDFKALDSNYGASIAVGDIDGDGTAEIIVGTGAGPNNSTRILIYKSDKTTILADFEAFPGMLGGVNVAVADFDGDGKAEIIVAPAGGSENPGTVKILAYNNGIMIPTGIEFLAQSSLSGVNIAAADTEGDLAPRLITSPVSGTDQDPGSIKIWKIDGIESKGTWTVSTPAKEIPLQGKYGATVAGGDVDGDGKDEIIAGMGADVGSSLVKILRTDGTVVNSIKTFDPLFGKFGVNVAAADLDGDGIAEIIAGVGADPSIFTSTPNPITSATTFVIYSANGVLIKALQPYTDTRYGVKVAVGDLGL